MRRGDPHLMGDANGLPTHSRAAVVVVRRTRLILPWSVPSVGGLQVAPAPTADELRVATFWDRPGINGPPGTTTAPSCPPRRAYVSPGTAPRPRVEKNGKKEKKKKRNGGYGPMPESACVPGVGDGTPPRTPWLKGRCRRLPWLSGAHGDGTGGGPARRLSALRG